MMTFPSRIDAAARGDVKPFSGRVFKDYLDTITDAAPGQWATFTIHTIHYGRRVGLPREELLDLLRVTGILDTHIERKPRTITGRVRPGRQRCGSCGQKIYTSPDGRLYKHPTREGGDDRCDGSYQAPVVEEPAA